MRITMVKKRLANGEPCEKCAQTEEMLRRRDLWEKIDEVVWAVEGDPDAPGWVIARRHGVEIAPFFVVEEGGEETLFKSPLKLIRTYFPDAPKTAPAAKAAIDDIPALMAQLADASPQEILRFALERWGDDCPIAFSGGEDVVLIDMASRLKLPFRVFTLDTGRLHSETYAFIDDIRRRYGLEVDVFMPDGQDVMDFMGRRGSNSFYRDGHEECCAVRQIRPLARALAGRSAWLTGQRRDDSRLAAEDLVAVRSDSVSRSGSPPLVRLNPLAGWTRDDVWTYVREFDVPMNPLHKQGFRTIGCAPCIRATSPNDPPRAVSWWWEQGVGTAPDAHSEGDGI